MAREEDEDVKAVEIMVGGEAGRVRSGPAVQNNNQQTVRTMIKRIDRLNIKE